MGKYEWAVGQEVMVTTIADHGRQEVIRTVEAVSRGVATVTGMRFRRDGSQITPRGELPSWKGFRDRAANELRARGRDPGRVLRGLFRDDPEDAGRAYLAAQKTDGG